MLGTVIGGRYRIDGLLGSGGMGNVYRASQLSVDRPVAIKVLHARQPDHGALYERLVHEASLAAALAHPNVVTILDYGRSGDGYFLVMELLVGRTLAQLMADEGPIEPLRVIFIMSQICQALRAAHRQGIVHRDLKPSNVAFAQATELDRLKVLDFGLAVRVDELRTQDPGENFLGSPKYCSPEHIDGKSIDGRSDLYSLGIIAYEMLTGRVPFTGPTDLATVAARMLCSIPPMSVPEPEPGSDALQGVILRCMARKPSDRFQSADELLGALDGAARALGVPSLQSVRRAINGTGASGVRSKIDLKRIEQALAERNIPTLPVPAAPRLPEQDEPLSSWQLPLDSLLSLPDVEPTASAAPTPTRAVPPPPPRKPDAEPARTEAPAKPPRRSRAWLWISIAVVWTALAVGVGAMVAGAQAASSQPPVPHARGEPVDPHLRHAR